MGAGLVMTSLHRVVDPASPARTAPAADDVLLFTNGGTVTVTGVTTQTIGTLTLEARRVTHTRDSYAFRVARIAGGGPGLVYSGDCGRAEDLDPLIRSGDTLLAEVSFGPGPIMPGANHLDGPAVGNLAARTGVGSVLLTHLQMGFDEAATIDSVRERFDGAVRLVTPGDRFTID